MAELPNENIHSQSLQPDRMTGKDRIGRTILATFIAALGPLSFGYCFGYSSSALIDLQNDNAPSEVRLSTEQGSWFSVSLILFLNNYINKKRYNNAGSTLNFICNFKIRVPSLTRYSSLCALLRDKQRVKTGLEVCLMKILWSELVHFML